MATPFLELHSISKQFGGVTALRGVDLSLAAGEVHCLVGENGSGKSTLIKIIAGVLRPEPGGRIVIEGREYPHLDPVQSTACGIQVIYQDLSLFPNLTVAENIAVASHFGAPRLVNWRALRATAQAAMERVGASLDLDARVEDLSIANRQLVAICRAMAADAKLVIMDEPTASLTRHEVDALVRLVAELKRSGICIVFVSHRLDEVMEIAERVTVLRDGTKVGDFPAREMDDRKLAKLMTGKAFAYQTRATDFSAASQVLSVNHLTRAGQYEDISLDIRAGEIVGLTGLLGSGRTEFALSLFGMNRPTSGEIRLNGKPLALKTNAEAIEEGIAYVSEDRLNLGLVLEQPISSNILVTVLDKLANGMGLVPEATRRRTARTWIDDLAIKAPDPDNAVRTLSGGNQQRVVLAKWMATQPKLLILDSPTVGVDIAAKDGIYEVVRTLADRGVAILLISDEVPEVFYHAHRVLVMRRGRLAGECIPHESSEEALQAMVDADVPTPPAARGAASAEPGGRARPRAERSPALARFRRSHEFWLLAVILALSLALGISTDSFLTPQNLFDLLTSNAFIGILASGLLVVLIAGGIDISFTATASVAQYVALTIGIRHGLGWLPLFALAGAVGILCGLINAVFITQLRISSIIVSIATLNIFYGLLIFTTGGKYITSLPKFFRDGISWFEHEDASGVPYALNLQVLILVLAFVAAWLLLNRTNIGRQIYAMGGNKDAAQRLGFHVFRLNCLVYAYLGVIAGIASLVQAQLAQSVTPTVLVGKELDVLAAVVLGGATLTGGVGTVFGALLGVALLAILQNGLVLVGVSSYWNQWFVGLTILCAVSITAWSERRRRAAKAIN